MKLNPDCIRDILLTIEENTDSERFFDYAKGDDRYPRFDKYDHNELLYHMSQCNMSSLVVGYRPLDAGSSVLINDLSPTGHQFLANIRQDNIWNGTKKIAAKVGSKSLEALTQIASSVITELIKAQFNLS